MVLLVVPVAAIFVWTNCYLLVEWAHHCSSLLCIMISRHQKVDCRWARVNSLSSSTWRQQPTNPCFCQELLCDIARKVRLWAAYSVTTMAQQQWEDTISDDFAAQPATWANQVWSHSLFWRQKKRKSKVTRGQSLFVPMCIACNDLISMDTTFS